MANRRIDQLNPNLNPLTGSELIPIFDINSNTTERISITTLGAFIDSTNDTFINAVGFSNSNDLLTLYRNDGTNLSTTISRYNRWYVPSGQTLTIPSNFQSFIYGDFYIEGTLFLDDNSQMVVINGDIILSGGTISGSGTTYLIDLPEYNSFVTNGVYNLTTKSIDFTGNFGFTPFSVDLNSLSTDNFYTTGGTYNSTTKNIDFSGNSTATTFSVDVSALLDDTNTFTTGATLNGNIIEFNRNDLQNAYSVDLTSLKFTGNTILECIGDIYVTNLNSCSPLHIQPTNNGNVYISESGGNVGIGTTNPITTLDVNGSVNISNSLSATTFYGDGSNLSGISSDTFVTGGTYSNGVLTLNRQNGFLSISGFSTGGGSTFTGGTVTGATIFTGGVTISSSTTNGLIIVGSGSTSPLFSVQGSNGQLFSISDDLTGDLFTVSTALGDPVLQVYDNNTILMGSYLVPLLTTTVKTTVNTSMVDIYAIPVSAYTGAFFDYTVNNGSNLRAGSIKSVWDGFNIVWDEVKTSDLGSTTGLIFNMSISGGTAILQSSGNTSNWTVKTSVRAL